MKTAAAPEQNSAGLQVVAMDRADPLSQCVRNALWFDIDNMGDHDVTGLYDLVMEEIERPLFETVLNHANGNLSHASRMLGMTRSTLRKRLGDYGIER